MPPAAEALADTPVTFEALDQLAAAVQGPALDAVLRWAAAGCAVRSLASEIQEAAMRISGLVTAIKGFTHMDQAMVAEPVDLGPEPGQHRCRAQGEGAAEIGCRGDRGGGGLAARARIRRRTQPDLGKPDRQCARCGSRTAADVEVKASREGERVVVRIVDNGPGIPAQIRERIFDPFFTTKPMGQGTGLGLDIVRRLCATTTATIEVDSQPGRTEFRVALPIAETQSTGPAR